MTSRRVFLIVIILLILLLFCLVPFCMRFIKKPPMPPKPAFCPQFQKGMTYVTWNRTAYGAAFSDISLSNLAKTGTQWVGIHATWYQDTINSTEIKPSQKTPTDESVIHAIQQAHKLGLKVMLKPQVDVFDWRGGFWRGDVDFSKAEDWQAWFNSYKDFIVHYAKMAQEYNVELFCIGTELTIPAVWQPELWRKVVIKNVREIYKGPITYAANWNEEYLLIKFWDELDYVGLDPYFPLSDKEKPTLEDLKGGWKKHLEEIEDWQKRLNKPVIFAEIGYKSSTGAAKTPWEHGAGKEIDLQLQADCFEALLETFWDKPWFYGVYWWYWGTNERMGGPNNRGFVVQNKPAQEIVAKWYKKRR